MLDKNTNLCLIANPIAGQGRAKRVALAAVQELKRRGYDPELKLTDDSGHAIELARELSQKGCEVIVAVGGDGTISEVANGIAGTGTKLGIIPGGTANDFVHEIGLPSSMRSAVGVIVKGATREIDLGRINAGRYFINVAGVGFDAAVIENLSPKLKLTLKDAAYVVACIKTLVPYEPPLLSIEADGTSHKGSFAVIGNTRHYGGIFQITPEAQVDDGYLDLCIFERAEKTALYKYLVGALARKHTAFKDVTYIKAKDIKITSNETIPVQADGDIVGATPVEFKVIPGALGVIVP